MLHLYSKVRYTMFTSQSFLGHSMKQLYNTHGKFFTSASLFLYIITKYDQNACQQIANK